MTTDVLDRRIAADTAHRRGNGLQPVPLLDKAITELYEVGRPIPDIAKALETTPRRVMEALGFDYRCAVCGMGVDLWRDGKTCDGADGDRTVEFWGVKPHGTWPLECAGGGHFIDRGGCEYRGDDPSREDY